ncbi:MAG: DUF4349 domain-containing protein [Clostridiaceae bacterium]|nr:DUF4349 domain-containing protein [Clostridiaceae bacterium]
MPRAKKIFVVLITLVLVTCAIAGCSLKRAADVSTAAGSAPKMSYEGEVNLAFSEDISMDTASPVYGKSEEQAAVDYAAQGIVGTGYSGTSSKDTSSGTSLDILSQRKVIRNANLSIEVDDFYIAYGNLQAMIKGIGYVSESNIHRDFYTYEDERRARVTGEITIRIDARHFDNILSDIKGLGEVIDDRIYSTDVTDQYFDTEGRLRVLKIEYEYLEEYMRSLTKPEDIFKTRTRMTELQTEIERLTGTLNKWNDLVELSTIYIRMTEKYPDEMIKKQSNTYWSRVENAFNRSIAGVINALGNLLIFIIEAIPTLVVLLLFAWIVYHIVKRLIAKRGTRNSESRADPGIKTNPVTKPEEGENI